MVLIKRFSLLIILLMATITLKSQTISYTYHSFMEDGCTVEYTPTIVNDTIYIVVCIKSEQLVFGENPTFSVRFFDDKVLQLYGQKISDNTQHGGIFISNFLVPTTQHKTIACFMVTDEQMAMFANGIAKIRLSTFPILHERIFKRDKIGFPLFESYRSIAAKVKKF